MQERDEREQCRHQKPDANTLHDRRGSKTELDALQVYAEPRRDEAHRHGREAHSDDASDDAHRNHLKEINRKHLPSARAETLQNRNASELLRDEDAHDAPNADATENQDHEAREAQVALAAFEPASEAGPRFPVRAYANELVRESSLEVPHEILDAVLFHAHQCLAPHSARKLQDVRALDVGVVDEHAWPQGEHPEATARFADDDPADFEASVSDENTIPDFEIEPGK